MIYEDGHTAARTLNPPFLIGRSDECALRVQHWRVAKRHVRVYLDESGCHLEDLGSLSSTTVNGCRLVRYGPVQPSDEIVFGPCLLRFTVLPEVTPCSVEIEPESPELNATVGIETLQTTVLGSSASYRELRKSLHVGLVKALDLRRHDIAALSTSALREYARGCALQLPAELLRGTNDKEREDLIELVVSEAVGLGVLEPMLSDPTVSEILVNAFDEIYVERAGVLTRSTAEFSSESAVRGIIERIVFPLGRRIDELSPMVDARLADGSRLNAVIAPISLRGASMTIRKFPKNRPILSDLVANNTLAQALADFLSLCIVNRVNILVAGGTGSGKTTLLNVLAGQIPKTQRIVTIEDSAELQIMHPHVVALETRVANAEGRGAITIRDLVRNALRMRPDRIVVGEVRGAECIDMLAAMNTGHEGSMTTLHANSPRDALARLETMALCAQSGLPLPAIRDQIASAIQLIVHQARLPSGRRIVQAVAEVCGVESGIIQTQTIARFDPGTGLATGVGLVPMLFDRNNLPLERGLKNWFALTC